MTSTNIYAYDMSHPMTICSRKLRHIRLLSVVLFGWPVTVTEFLTRSTFRRSADGLLHHMDIRVTLRYLPCRGPVTTPHALLCHPSAFAPEEYRARMSHRTIEKPRSASVTGCRTPMSNCHEL